MLWSCTDVHHMHRYLRPDAVRTHGDAGTYLAFVINLPDAATELTSPQLQYLYSRPFFDKVQMMGHVLIEYQKGFAPFIVGRVDDYSFGRICLL